MSDHTLTSTKRKAIRREASAYGASVIPYDVVKRIASRHSLTHQLVINVLRQDGRNIGDEVIEAKPAMPDRPRRLPAHVSPAAINLIRSCKLYHTLEPDSEYVIVRRADFMREREAILAIINMLPSHATAEA